MPLISGTIPSLIGGVSQQDASVRQPFQLEECLNCNLSPANGAGPRPGAQFVAVLGSDIPDTAFFHSIIRDSRERYVVIIYDSKIRVFNHLTGKEYQVVQDKSDSYLTTTQRPWQSLRAITVDDTTFIANRDVIVKMADRVTPGAVAGTVQTFGDLPKDYYGGSDIYEIQGDSSNAFDNYYVQRQAATVWRECARPGQKDTMDKATMPHVLKRIPDTTNPDGFYFAYGPQDYDARFAGDDNSCPPPSFVGSRIGDLFFHKDRLGIAAGAGDVVLSEIGHYFNFWRTTVTSLLDSDCIDINLPTEGAAEVLHVKAYQSALMIFATGNTSLFQLTGSPTLTPKTAQISPVLNYQVHPIIRPVIAGSSLFFCDDSSVRPWTTVREYFLSNEIVTPEAANITSHVPAYVPGNTRCMETAPDVDMMFMAHQSPSGSQVYVHQFRWDGDQKVQSSWHPWTIQQAGAVVHMHAIGTMLYVVAKAAGGGVELLSFDLSQSPRFEPVSPDFDIYLDRRQVVTPRYQQFGNYTDLTVPFILPTLDRLAVLKTSQWDAPGAYLDITGATLVNGGQTLRLQGKWDAGDLVVGYRFTRRVTLSQPFLRDSNGVTKIIGRLQLRRMTVRFNNAAYFRCLVYPKGRPEAIDTLLPQLTNTFTARTVGDAEFLLDAPSVSSGVHTFLVASRSDAVSVALDSDSPYPCWWESVAWEGTYTTRVRM